MWTVSNSFSNYLRLQVAHETVVAKLEQSLWEKLPNNTEFAQEVKKIKKKKKTDSLIYVWVCNTE